jgi:hypothetical protein
MSALTGGGTIFDGSNCQVVDTVSEIDFERGRGLQLWSLPTEIPLMLATEVLLVVMTTIAEFLGNPCRREIGKRFGPNQASRLTSISINHNLLFLEYGNILNRIT